MLKVLRQAVGRYSGTLRTWKPLYMLLNMLNKNKLNHNKPLYQAAGVYKSVVAPISSADFKPTELHERPWLDQPDALARMEEHPSFAGFSAPIQDALRTFVKDGYAILKGYFNADEVSTFNQEIERLLTSKQVDFNFTGRKLMNAHKASTLIDENYFRRKETIELLSFILGRTAKPFQSITFREGSEQRAHSDSVHMMTQPEGYLIATWTAFEPTSDKNGALFYYPGSHKLPIVTTQDFDAGHTALRIGHDANARYEEAIDALIKREGLERKSFNAEAGDMLIWHANLLHGGGEIQAPGSSRRSLVGHYFADDVICYHELTHRPALMDD